MRIVLMRHGMAIDREHPECPAEADRPLTDEGEQRTRRAAAGLRNLDLRPDRLICSPWKRARQTAKICARVLDFHARSSSAAKIEVRDDLLPDHDPASFVEYLRSLRENDELLVVGHAPHLDRVLAHLVGAPGVVLTSLKKAGAVSVAGGTAEAGQIEWLLTPRVLRRLGRG